MTAREFPIIQGHIGGALSQKTAGGKQTKSLKKGWTGIKGLEGGELALLELPGREERHTSLVKNGKGR